MSLSVVKAIVQRDDGCILAVQKREDHDSFMAGQWELPGGKQQPDETITDTIVRELREETGLMIDSFTVLAETTMELPRSMHRVLGLVELDEPTVTLSAEHQSYRWVEPEHFRDLSLHRDAKYAIPVVEHLSFYREV
ncbi:MAG: NUDIX domain-containing protein [Candidatus Nanohaloarchaeota archaeon QJJ-5]|nr:NUDIX domain-containing protein [Candidatus Nanohaloarchaeota archaeon QJJ-5]